VQTTVVVAVVNDVTDADTTVSMSISPMTFYKVTLYTRFIQVIHPKPKKLDSDRSPVRSAFQSNITSQHLQNLSKHVLNIRANLTTEYEHATVEGLW